jgi:hypothetical protein
MTELIHNYRVFIETQKKANEARKMLLTLEPENGNKDDTLKCQICSCEQTVTNC